MTNQLRIYGTTVSFAVGLGAAASGCTLALGITDETPCLVDEDCRYSGDRIGMCVSKVCRPPGDEGSDGGTVADDDGPTDGQATVDDGDSGPDGGTDGSGSGSEDEGVGSECTLNSDCSMDQRCSDAGTCISLLSEHCRVVQWPADDERDNVVFVGSILPTAGLFEQLVAPLQNAIQLGIEDFNDATALQADRKIAWVGCDDTEGPEASVAAAQHLVDNVGVPAIVGPLLSDSILAVAEEVTIPAEVLLMAPGGGAERFAELQDNDYVWHTLPEDVYLVNATADLLTQLEPEPARLLVLAQDSLQGAEFLDRVVTALDGPLPADVVTALEYSDPVNFATEAALLAAYGSTIAQAYSVLPPYEAQGDHYTHVVMIGAGETQVLLYAYLNQWRQQQIPEQPSPAMPTFYFVLGGAAYMEQTVNQIGSLSVTSALVPYKEDVLEHLEGVLPSIFDPTNFNAFNIRYKIRFNEQDAVTATSLTYDGVMSVLFAMCTVPGDRPVTGPDVAAAMPRLNDPSGTFVSFSGTSLDFIEAARNALVVEGGSVDLRGVSGDLDWNSSGGVRADAQQWVLDNIGTSEAPEARVDVYRTYNLDPEPAVDGEWTP